MSSFSSVPGIPSSCARLSAITSKRRIRPAIASFVNGGSANRPNSSNDACLLATRSCPAYLRCSGTSSPKICRARSTRAPAATAACAERRRFASSKFASRFAVARTSLRVRCSRHVRSDSEAPIRSSRWAIVSPSRTTTRSTPRTSRAFAITSRRRAAPTNASAASGPGQVNSIADERPGSVNDPCAKNAPRITASASCSEPFTTAGGKPRTGLPRKSSSPVCRASASPPESTRTI